LAKHAYVNSHVILNYITGTKTKNEKVHRDEIKNTLIRKFKI